MKTWKLTLLMLSLAATTAAFTHKPEEARPLFAAKSATYQQIVAQMDARLLKEVQVRNKEFAFSDVVLVHKELRFKVKNYQFTMKWIGGKKTAMTFNDMRISYDELKDKEILRAKLTSYFKPQNKNQAFNLFDLFMSQAFAQQPVVCNGCTVQPQPRTFDDLMKDFTTENFSLLMSRVLGMALAFNNMWNVPNNPFGFHSKPNASDDQYPQGADFQL